MRRVRGPFKTMKEVEEEYDELLLRFVKATPTCIVSRGKKQCWGNEDEMRKILGEMARLAEQAGFKPEKTPEEIDPPGIGEKVVKVAEYLAENYDADTGTLERLEKEYGVAIIVAEDDTNGRYIVTVP